jgi:hypothetical protein
MSENEHEYKEPEALKKAPCIEIKNVNGGWCLGINYLSTKHPILEQLSGGRTRLVVEMSDMAAEELRLAFSLPRVPAPLDASEAIVRATHALHLLRAQLAAGAAAGATIELTSLIREISSEHRRLK